VTGASYGIGRAAAVGLARAGHDLVLVARSDALLQSVATEVSSEGATAQLVVADLATENGRQSVHAAIADIAGLHAFVHCASATTDPDDEANLEGTSSERIHEVAETTYVATANLLSMLGPELAKSAPAHVIVLVSDWALEGSHGPPLFSSSKAAVLQLLRTCRREFARRGVFLTALVPGDIASFDESWEEPKWSLDDPIDSIRAELGDTRISLADVVDSILFVLSRQLARVDEIRLSPLDAEYDY
jgi:short-subunit dehydrogenase